jgi:hypothetical protein
MLKHGTFEYYYNYLIDARRNEVERRYHVCINAILQGNRNDLFLKLTALENAYRSVISDVPRGTAANE